MRQEDVAELSRAIHLAQTSNKTAAHSILINLAAKYPGNTLILLWFAFTAPTLAESRSAISRATQLAPANPDVKSAQSWLDAEIAKAGVTTPALAPKADAFYSSDQTRTGQLTPSVPSNTPEINTTGGDYSSRLNQAVALAQTGNKGQAYQNFKALAKETGAKDTNVLLWVAFTSPDLEEADTAIKMAESQNPANPNIEAARLWLRQEKQKAPVNFSTTAFQTQVAPSSFAFQPATTPNFSAYRQADQTGKVETNPQPAGNRAFNIIDFAPNPTPAAPTQGRKKVDTLTILAVVLGVLVVAFIAWGVYFFTSSSNASASSQNVFDKVSLPTYSEMEKLELSQTAKDRLSGNYTSPELTKNGVKVTQVDFYKVKTSGSGKDFIKFYQSELNKDGWNVRSLPIPTVSQQPFLIGIKSHSYIFIGTAVPNGSASELSSQLAPNQSVAFAMLLEQTQPQPNS